MTDKKISILIIEHDLEDIKLMGNFLKQNNFEVLFATNEVQALKIAVNKSPDIILLNTISNGIVIFEELKRDERTNQIPVIFMFTPSEKQIFSSINNFKCVDFIYKPVNTSELLFRIHKLIEILHLKTNLRKVENILGEDLQISIAELNKMTDALIDTPEKKEKIRTVISKISESFREIETLHKWEKTPIGTNKNPKKITKVKSSILVVEDNELSQKLLESILSEEYNVIIAGTGKKALQFIKDNNPDAILLDMSLPDMTGPEIYREMKKTGNTKPVIAVSGYSKVDINEKYPDIHFDDYLLKPVSSDMLITAVKNLLNHETGLKTYDYSKALKLSDTSKEEFKNWLGDFVSLLKQCVISINNFHADKQNKIEKSIMHGLLNYTVYFGACELKECIWKYKESEANGDEKTTDNLLFQIEKEAATLLSFYQQIDV